MKNQYSLVKKNLLVVHLYILKYGGSKKKLIECPFFVRRKDA